MEDSKIENLFKKIKKGVNDLVLEKLLKEKEIIFLMKDINTEFSGETFTEMFERVDPSTFNSNDTYYFINRFDKISSAKRFELEYKLTLAFENLNLEEQKEILTQAIANLKGE